MSADIKSSPLRVAYLGSANWDLIGRDFQNRCTAQLGLPAQVAKIPFNQYRSWLLDPQSSLRQETWDVWIFCERLEDFIEDAASLDGEGAQRGVSDRVSDYLECIRNARGLTSARFLVLDLTPVRPTLSPLDDAGYAATSPRGFVQSQNARLAAACASVPDCQLLRLSTLVETHGSLQADPGKYWLLGRMPFSPAFGGIINDHIFAHLLAQRGQTTRLLIVDLDNTLWGGIIGEDGLKGIKLGSDFPGNAYVEIQRCLRALNRQGIALAICSRNTESTALDAIAQHPAMILRPDDFVARRINWGDKAENIRALATEVGVGLANVCFLDDSPYERELVRRALPAVRVPELPAEVSEWPAWLSRYPYLARATLTAEDRGRAERYRVRAQIQQQSTAFANRADYWRSLQMRLYFHRLNDGNLQRTLQLLAKTNQFNLSNRRHQEMDLKRLQAAGARVVPIGLSDKFTPAEIVGVAIVTTPDDRRQPAELESLVLSCRVLGRSVETAVLGWICELVRKNGLNDLRGTLVRTERNQPVQTFLSDHGFSEDGSRLLLRSDKFVSIPDYFEITED